MLSLNSLPVPVLMLLMLHSTFCVVAGDTDQPNIVFILADDMGYGDLKSLNPDSKIATPNLDQLANQGICFTDAHSGGSTCRPSRYALLTGRFAARRKKFNDRAGPLIEQGRPTIANMLRDNGYQTAMVGKWHLGFDQKLASDTKRTGFAFDYQQPLTGGPIDRGFDTFFGMHASLDIPPYFYIRNRTAVSAPTERIAARDSLNGPEGWNQIQGAFWRAGDVAPNFKHADVTPRFAREACHVIEKHSGKKRLFLYVALPSPHTPWLPADEFVGKSQAGMYGDFAMMVDDVVGQILKSLHKASMDDNTLVLFSSDNGPVWYEKDFEKFGHRSTGSLRGIKGSAWEGGHRVPLIARWPEVIRSGSRNESTIAFSDVYATLAEIAGQNKIRDGIAEDSISFLSALQGQTIDDRPPILHGREVIRDGDWKLIDSPGGRGFGAKRMKYGPELYNLREDVSETRNLIVDRADKAAEIRRKLKQVSAHPTRNQSETWIDLFNGKDLANWKANSRPESFSVENGLLKVHGINGISHLFYTDKNGEDVSFKNFELEATVRSEPNSNSGIFFHTNRTLRKKKYLDYGYEVQLNSAKKEKRKTGSLYGIVDLPSSPVDETQWFQVRIKVKAKRIQVFLNDTRVVDYTEPENPPRNANRRNRLLGPEGGAIAIQAHDPDSVFFFKSLRVRKLR